MAHHRLGIALAGIAVLVASASATASGPLPTGVHDATCAAQSSVRHEAGLGSTTALQEYDDNILDVRSAPDICMSNLVTNDNLVFTMAIHIHDRTAFAAGDAYRVALDTDSNPATGAPASAGPEVGAEYVVDLAEPVSTLGAWNGSAFVPVAPQPEIPTVWLPGYGPLLQFARSALGNPQAVTLVLKTTSADDLDLAPDSGSWSYAVTPLALTAGKLTVGPARAGQPLAASMEVLRSDFDMALDQGAISCKASVAGKQLAGRGRFARELVGCTWRLPQNARGKLVRGTVSVTFQGVTARRSFALRAR